MNRHASVILAVGALALAVASCGGTNGNGNGGAGGGGDGSPAKVARSGGSITVGAAKGIPQLNPAIRTFAWEEVLFPLMWNALSKTGPDGKVVPDLAQSWKASKDQRTWTFTLRTDVKFSNGKALTAKDVVDTFEYYLDDDTATQEKNKIQTISNVEALGDDRVRFKLEQANALFPEAIVWVKVLQLDSLDRIDKEPVVTGPFKVKEFVPDDRLTLVRNDAYFGEPAPLDEIRIVKAQESTAAVTALRSGDLDVLWGVPASNVAEFENSTDIKLVRPKLPSQWPSWEMDTTSPPFDDVRARQALAYAVDRKAILEAAYFGQGTLAPTNNALSTKNPWYGGDLVEYTYDLDKAKQLFAEAGVKEGDTLTWWGTAGSNPEWATSGEILQASLKEIGINLKIDNRETSAWAEKFYPAGKKYPGLIVPNFQSTPPEPGYSLNFYVKGRCECNWDSPEFERAYREALAEPDEAARKALWGRVQEIINRDVPLIVPFQSTVVSGVRSDVGGVWVEGGGQLHLEQAGKTV
jgi:peptide/nickel transport system substrate-binding protein